MEKRIKVSDDNMTRKGYELSDKGYKRVQNAYWVEIWRNKENDEIILERI